MEWQVDVQPIRLQQRVHVLHEVELLVAGATLEILAHDDVAFREDEILLRTIMSRWLKHHVCA